MKSIDGIYEDLFIINKSKFFAFAYPITNEDEAKKYISDLNEKYADATHVCTAYLLSSPKVERANDDGEPSGTAGKPMLELLKKRGIENVLIAVVRYFGGVKLGAGGLVRAYTNASNLVLDKAQIVEMKNVDEYLIKCDIALGNRIMEIIRQGGGEILACKYAEKVEIKLIDYNLDKLKTLYPDVSVEKLGSRVVCQK